MDEIYFLAENQFIDMEDFILRPVSLADVDDMFEYASQTDVTAYLSWRHHQSKFETRQVIAHLFMPNPLGKWAIVEKSTEKMIGMFEIKFNSNEREATFGYVLNPAYWGRGIMAKVGCKVIALSFENLPLKRIFGVFVTENRQSERVMQKMGLSYKREYKGMIMKKIRRITEYELTRKNYCLQQNS